jgi:hypothetical protein
MPSKFSEIQLPVAQPKSKTSPLGVLFVIAGVGWLLAELYAHGSLLPQLDRKERQPEFIK